MSNLFDNILTETYLRERMQVIKEAHKYTWEQISVALYGILDDIDTADDACKENAEDFRKLVMRLQAKKNEYMESTDGYTVHRVNETYGDSDPFAVWAKKELERAGLFSEDSDYDGMLGEAVMKLVDAFSGQGHSGMSAALTADIFNRLAGWKPLTALTDNPDEWQALPEGMAGRGMEYQSTRSPDCFSTDGGKTYWSSDDPCFQVVENGEVVATTGGEERWAKRIIHTSVSHKPVATS